MGLKPQLSYSSGELDPVLHDRVTLEKFNKGLATARNAMIGKTGSILSRFPRLHFVKAKDNAKGIKIFCPPNSNYLTEWGDLYVRVYTYDSDLTPTLVATVVHAYTEAQLSLMHFVPSGKYIYVFLYGQQMLKLLYDDATPAFVAAASIFAIPTAPTALSITATGTPAGYAVDYYITLVKNGEESLGVEDTSGTYKKPDASTQKNTLTVTIDADSANIDKYNEVRVYRRPNQGGAYGFLGSTTYFYDSSGALKADFEDLGGLADFTNGVQSIITKEGFDGANLEDLNPRTGAVYQQRFLMSTENDEEALLASRPGFQNNFYRDFPYDDDGALKFKSGTTGKADVLRIVENDGLIVFTSIGVYVSVGTLGVDNLALDKKGSWVIDESIPPLAVPGGVFFVDKNTHSVQQLIYSQDILTYQSLDVSIFSNHLFKQKTITSWAFQEGVLPLIKVTFSDGTFATFTYHFEHQMKAWTRHDSAYKVEQIEGTGVADTSFYVTNKDGNRYIEVSLPRYVSPTVFSANSEADKLAPNAFMDACYEKKNLLNDSLGGSDVFLLTPVVADTWDGALTLTCGTSALFPDPGLGVVGTIFRFFDTTDKSTVDLEVTARASDNSVTVSPSAEFPSAQASGFRMYETFTTVTGLDHLEGENVGILLDGYVSNSPNNDVEGYSPVTVASGSITIPDNERGAIIIVGRPIVSDLKTLNISTVEQKPTLIESLTVNKLYIRINETRGLYVANKFPEEDSGSVDGSSVVGMEDLDIFFVPSGTDIIGNRYKEPVSKRIEQTIKGDWESQGQIAIRQVDPVHYEILSIIPDVEVEHRSDR